MKLAIKSLHSYQDVANVAEIATEKGGQWQQETVLTLKSVRVIFVMGMTLKNGFSKSSLFVLSANGWKNQYLASSFSRKRKS